MYSSFKQCLAFGLVLFCITGLGEVQAQYNKMMVVGNSLTGGDKEIPELDWYGLQGMAASEVSKDFVHVLHSKLQADQTGSTLQLEIGHIEDEPNTMTGLGRNTVYYDTAITATNADLLVFELGDNFSHAPTWENFGQNYKNTIQSIAAGGNNPDIYIVGTWMYNVSAEKTRLLQRVAYEVGATYVSIDGLSDDPANLGKNEPYAYPSWATSGVGTHPGDTGMAAIADIIYGHVSAPTPVVLNPQGTNLLVNGNFESDTIATGQSVYASTLALNGWTLSGDDIKVANMDGFFDRTDSNFLVTSAAFTLTQATSEIEADKKYTFLLDMGYSTSWYGLNESAFAAIAEFDADGNWIQDLAILDNFESNQSGIANQLLLEYITGDSVTEGNLIGVRIGIDSLPDSGEGVLWDNASLTVGSVPEPATVTLLTVAGIATLIRRQK